MTAAPQEAATPAPRERGILFSAPMVRAILAGKKTQTRRAWKEQPLDVIAAQRSSRVIDGRRGWAAKFSEDPPGGKLVRCRFGEVGDRLWVRETWRKVDGEIRFRAGAAELVGETWKPGIHLRRADARLLLEITDVRVQRLQDISEADARAEGIIQWIGESGAKHYGLTVADAWETTARGAFQRLWNDINGERAHWDSSPWVWALTFRRLP